MVSVSDHAKIFVLGGEQLCQNILRDVRVLIFVDGNVTEAFLIFVQDVGVLAENFYGDENQVVEVQQIILSQFFLVERVNFSGVHGVRAVVGKVNLQAVFEVNQIIFEVGDSEVDVGVKIFVQAQLVDALAD